MPLSPFQLSDYERLDRILFLVTQVAIGDLTQLSPDFTAANPDFVSTARTFITGLEELTTRAEFSVLAGDTAAPSADSATNIEVVTETAQASLRRSGRAREALPRPDVVDSGVDADDDVASAAGDTGSETQSSPVGATARSQSSTIGLSKAEPPSPRQTSVYVAARAGEKRKERHDEEEDDDDDDGSEGTMQRRSREHQDVSMNSDAGVGVPSIRSQSDTVSDRRSLTPMPQRDASSLPLSPPPSTRLRKAQMATTDSSASARAQPHGVAASSGSREATDDVIGITQSVFGAFLGVFRRNGQQIPGWADVIDLTSDTDENGEDSDESNEAEESDDDDDLFTTGRLCLSRRRQPVPIDAQIAQELINLSHTNKDLVRELLHDLSLRCANRASAMANLIIMLESVGKPTDQAREEIVKPIQGADNNALPASLMYLARQIEGRVPMIDGIWKLALVLGAIKYYHTYPDEFSELPDREHVPFAFRRTIEADIDHLRSEGCNVQDLEEDYLGPKTNKFEDLRVGAIRILKLVSLLGPQILFTLGRGPGRAPIDPMGKLATSKIGALTRLFHLKIIHKVPDFVIDDFCTYYKELPCIQEMDQQTSSDDFSRVLANLGKHGQIITEADFTSFKVLCPISRGRFTTDSSSRVIFVPDD